MSSNTKSAVTVPVSRLIAELEALALEASPRAYEPVLEVCKTIASENIFHLNVIHAAFYKGQRANLELGLLP